MWGRRGLQRTADSSLAVAFAPTALGMTSDVGIESRVMKIVQGVVVSASLVFALVFALACGGGGMTKVVAFM